MLYARWPTEDRPLTVDDLTHLSCDDIRYELTNGSLQVLPPPRLNHQRVVSRLLTVLFHAVPVNLDVLIGPALVLADDHLRRPDLVVANQVPLTAERSAQPPLLVVEVASRSTEEIDRTTKKDEYAAFGIDLYWIAVPDLNKPSLTAFELHEGKYEQVAMAAGDQAFEAVRPFAVRIIPNLLVADGRAWRSMLSG